MIANGLIHIESRCHTENRGEIDTIFVIGIIVGSDATGVDGGNGHVLLQMITLGTN